MDHSPSRDAGELISYQMPNTKQSGWTAAKCFLGLVGIFAIASSGCVRVERSFGSTKTSHTVTPALQQIDTRMLVFRQRPEGNSAVFESDKVTLVFPDLKRSERNSFDREELAIQISGSGRSETMRSCNRNGRLTTFRAVYEDGVSTITFCGREVKLTNGAQTVLVGDRTIELTGETPMVMVIAKSERGTLSVPRM